MARTSRSIEKQRLEERVNFPMQGFDILLSHRRLDPVTHKRRNNSLEGIIKEPRAPPTYFERVNTPEPEPFLKHGKGKNAALVR